MMDTTKNPAAPIVIAGALTGDAYSCYSGYTGDAHRHGYRCASPYVKRLQKAEVA